MCVLYLIAEFQLASLLIHAVKTHNLQTFIFQPTGAFEIVVDATRDNISTYWPDCADMRYIYEKIKSRNQVIREIHTDTLQVRQRRSAEFSANTAIILGRTNNNISIFIFISHELGNEDRVQEK